MTCPKCGGTANVQSVQVSAGTNTHKRGCLWTLGRWFLILCTCGLWLLVGKSKSRSNTKFINDTMAICQSCGYHWKV